MDSERILGLILDIGAEMIRCGAETHRVEDSLYRLCRSYGFLDCNVWVVPSNIQSTITAPDGQRITQIRAIHSSGVDFDMLDRLNSLCRRSCLDTPDADELLRRLSEVKARPMPGAWVHYVAGALAGAGFGVFFNCDALDAVVALLASLFVTFLGRQLGKHESNPMILNFVISFFAEFLILVAVHFGFGRHSGYITIGMVMLLISGLGTTNGIRDLVHLDTFSGVINISVSFTGAVGIALGIALPLLLLPGWGSNEIMILNPNVLLSLGSCAVSGLGFALWFGVRGRQIAVCMLGAFLTWTVYLITYRFLPVDFAATLAGSAMSALFAQIMARVNKAPATTFQTVSAIPLIPGASLYYMMYGFVTQNYDFALKKGVDLVMACFGIVLGFMVIEVVSKYIFRPAGGRNEGMKK